LQSTLTLFRILESDRLDTKLCCRIQIGDGAWDERTHTKPRSSLPLNRLHQGPNLVGEYSRLGHASMSRVRRGLWGGRGTLGRVGHTGPDMWMATPHASSLDHQLWYRSDFAVSCKPVYGDS